MTTLLQIGSKIWKCKRKMKNKEGDPEKGILRSKELKTAENQRFRAISKIRSERRPPARLVKKSSQAVLEAGVPDLTQKC